MLLANVLQTTVLLCLLPSGHLTKQILIEQVKKGKESVKCSGKKTGIVKDAKKVEVAQTQKQFQR